MSGRPRRWPGGPPRMTSSPGATCAPGAPGSRWTAGGASASSPTTASCSAPRAGAPSRGGLIPELPAPPAAAEEYFGTLTGHAQEYSGFNLLLADGTLAVVRLQSRHPVRAAPCRPGSTVSPTRPWTPRGRSCSACGPRLQDWLREAPDAPVETLFSLLADRTRADDAPLPETGLERQWERVLSSPFVQDPDYGTRCSTVLMLEAAGGVLPRRAALRCEARAGGRNVNSS